MFLSDLALAETAFSTKQAGRSKGRPNCVADYHWAFLPNQKKQRERMLSLISPFNFPECCHWWCNDVASHVQTFNHSFIHSFWFHWATNYSHKSQVIATTWEWDIGTGLAVPHLCVDESEQQIKWSCCRLAGTQRQGSAPRPLGGARPLGSVACPGSGWPVVN
jgi:hypothetical protein